MPHMYISYQCFARNNKKLKIAQIRARIPQSDHSIVSKSRVLCMWHMLQQTNSIRIHSFAQLCDQEFCTYTRLRPWEGFMMAV